VEGDGLDEAEEDEAEVTLPHGDRPAYQLPDWEREAAVMMAVGIFHLGVPIDIHELAHSLPNTEVHNNSLPNRLKLRSFRGKTRFSAIINVEGKVMVTTNVADEELRNLCKRIARAVRDHHNAAVRFKGYKVGSLRSIAKLAYAVNLSGLAEDGMQASAPFKVLHLEVRKALLIVNRWAGDEDPINLEVHSSGLIKDWHSGSLEQTQTALGVLLPYLRSRRDISDPSASRYSRKRASEETQLPALQDKLLTL